MTSLGFCPGCGTKASSGASFCSDCGRSLDTGPIQHDLAAPPALLSAPQQQPRPTLSWKTRFWRIAIITSVVLVVAGFVAFKNGDPNSKNINYAGTYLWGVVAGFWILVGFFAIIWSAHRAVGEAVKPIPSLQEIESQLRQEGYNPSLQDCLAVEARLKSNRNEAIVVAGAIILGTNLAARQARASRCCNQRQTQL